MSVKVLTVTVNTNFIELQYYTLKKFMKTNYEFIVFNDAKNFPDYTNDGDLTIKEDIHTLCKKLNIKCIDVPNDEHKNIKHVSIRAGMSYNFMLKYQLENPGKYLVIDGDMFLIDYFDISDYDRYSSAIVLQINEGVNYVWNGVYYFDTIKLKDTDLIDWGCYHINPRLMLDTGSMMYKWLDKQINFFPDVKEIRNNDKKQYHSETIYFIRHLWSLTWDESEFPKNIDKQVLEFMKEDPRNEKGKFYCEIYDNKFLHYRSGSNWKCKEMQNLGLVSGKLHNLYMHRYLAIKLRSIYVNE